MCLITAPVRQTFDSRRRSILTTDAGEAVVTTDAGEPSVELSADAARVVSLDLRILGKLHSGMSFNMISLAGGLG